LSVRERDYIFFVNISKSGLVVNDYTRISYFVYRKENKRKRSRGVLHTPIKKIVTTYSI